MPEFPSTYDPRIVPSPPRLHWGWVLALQVLTLGLFTIIWLVVQAYWAKRITGKSRAFVWSIANLALLPTLFLILVVSDFFLLRSGRSEDVEFLGTMLSSSSRVLFLITNLATVITLYGQLQSWPISMSLNGIATFFLQSIYFQYRLNDYVVPSAEEVYGAIPPAPAYVPPANSTQAIVAPTIEPATNGSVGNV